MRLSQIPESAKASRQMFVHAPGWLKRKCNEIRFAGAWFAIDGKEAWVWGGSKAYKFPVPEE